MILRPDFQRTKGTVIRGSLKVARILEIMCQMCDLSKVIRKSLSLYCKIFQHTFKHCNHYLIDTKSTKMQIIIF